MRSSNTSEYALSVSLENLFISSKASFTINGSLTIHNCTIFTNFLVINMVGGSYNSSRNQKPNLQSYFDRYTVKMTKTSIIGSDSFHIIILGYIHLYFFDTF